MIIFTCSIPSHFKAFNPIIEEFLENDIKFVLIFSISKYSLKDEIKFCEANNINFLVLTK